MFVVAYRSLQLNLDYLHASVRWAIEGPKYKMLVASRFSGNPDSLAHVEWDGWGFAGLETNAYLVYDPRNALALAAARNEHRARGIRCPFYRARMLEPSYYSVTFYTETDWDHCDY